MKELWKKIPLWAKILLPIALVILAVAFFRKGGGSGLPWKTPSVPDERPGSAAPITPEKGEEIKEEVREEAAAEIEKIEEEQDEIKAQVDDWMKRLE